MSVAPIPRGDLLAKAWAARAQKFDLEQLDRFRKTAENWRNGLSGLTALLGVATVIRGPELADELSNDTRNLVLIIQLVGLGSLLVSALLAMNAAYGMPASLPLSGENLRSWERKEIRTGQTKLRWAKILSVLGILIVGWAIVLTAINQVPGVGVVAVRGDDEVISCGAFVSGDSSGLTLTVRDQFGEDETRTFSYNVIQEVRLLAECPEN